MKNYIIYTAIGLIVILTFFVFKISFTYLILLACPLLHLVMMKGMHKNHTEEDKNNPENKENKSCH